MAANYVFGGILAVLTLWALAGRLLRGRRVRASRISALLDGHGRYLGLGMLALFISGLLAGFPE